MAAKPVTRYIAVDVKAAERMLLKNRPHEPGVKGTNRKISKAKVAKYAAEMAAGGWRVTHQGIGFDEDGWLVDGQHRLLAIREAARVNPDIVITMAVTSNLDPATFKYVDLGIRRKLSDSLASQGYTNVGLLSSTGRLVYCYFYVPYTGIKSWQAADIYSADVQDEVIEKYPSIFTGVVLMTGAKRKIANQTAMAAGYTIAAELRPDVEVDLFFHQVITGQDIGAGNPAYELRERLHNMAASGKVGTNAAKVAQLACIVKAFNKFAAGERVVRGSLRLTENESFPRVDKAPDEDDI